MIPQSPPLAGPGPGYLPTSSPADVERHRLAQRAEGLWAEILVLFVLLPYAFVLLVRGLRTKRALEERGLPVPGATKAAIGCGGAGSLGLLLGLAATAAVLFWTALVPPRLWIANGLDETVRVTIDGRDQGRLELGRPRSFDLQPGRHQLCVRPLGGEPTCAERELARQEAILWNPGSEARFVRGVTYFRASPLAPRPDEVVFVPRGEWLPVEGLDHYFELPPDEVDTSLDEERRAWIQQAFSSPVLLYVDNATGGPVDVLADGAVVASLQADQWVSVRLREGNHDLVVRQGETVVVALRATLRDFGTYLLDCTSGRAQYLDATYEGEALVETAQLTGAALHDVSDFASVFGHAGAKAEWAPATGTRLHRVEFP